MDVTSPTSVATNNQSWGSDNSNFTQADNRWPDRGGNYNNGSNAGVFYSGNNNGNPNNNYAFRAALLPLP